MSVKDYNGCLVGQTVVFGNQESHVIESPSFMVMEDDAQNSGSRTTIKIRSEDGSGDIFETDSEDLDLVIKIEANPNYMPEYGRF